ncbi:MAG: alpha/beta fold hydrolase, partial [Ornithinimicrobium sp.]
RILTAAAIRQVGRQRQQVELAAERGTDRHDGPGASTIQAAGTDVRVRVSGPDRAEGGTALLLHGIGRSLQDWDEQHARLSARHKVISLDLPGFGFSPRSPAGMGLNSLADAAVATLDALGESAPVHLVGNSLGGAVAMTVLARHPERVRTLTLASSAGFGAKASLDLRMLAVPGLGPWLLRRPTRTVTARVERTLYADPRLATPERIDHALALALVPGRAEAFREALLSVGSIRRVRPGWRRVLLKRLRAHRVPALVVWGEQDTVLPSEQLSSAADALPHARTILLADTGHLPQVERPDRFAAEVLRLWTEADGQASP